MCCSVHINTFKECGHTKNDGYRAICIGLSSIGDGWCEHAGPDTAYRESVAKPVECDVEGYCLDFEKKRKAEGKDHGTSGGEAAKNA